MSKDIVPQEGDFLLYTGPDGKISIEVLFLGESVWLSQKRMAELFGVDVTTINYHLKELLDSLEIAEATSVGTFPMTAADGKTYATLFYNLEAIIRVGYKVNSDRAKRFRAWATQTLGQFVVKGFAIDDVRLKNGRHFGKDYFDELLEKIREIRASERRFYQKITDLYAQASSDYDKSSEVTKSFYKTVQNKLHWAISGKTAAELIAERADSKKPHMGLTTWKNAPKGKVLKSDVAVAKNFLEQDEMSELNRVVTMYLDYAENQAKKQHALTMDDWSEKLNAFLKFNDYEILDNPGKVSHDVAVALAEKEFEKFRIVQDAEFISDFDEEARKYLGEKSE